MIPVASFLSYLILFSYYAYAQSSLTNFTELSLNSPWTVWNGTDGKLVMNLWQPLSSNFCGTNVSICYIKGESSSILGKYKYVKDGPIMKFTGEHCSNTSSFTTVRFRCGKTMGFPKFLPSVNSCNVTLEWETITVCKPESPFTKPQMSKCYGYDSSHSLVHLESLQGEYQVDNGDDDDDDDDSDDGVKNIKGGIIMISVCRNMESSSPCPGMAACLRVDGNKFSLGSVTSPLTVDEGTGHSHIEYTEDNSTLPGCRDVRTRIDFFCPEKGIGSSPLLISRSKCAFRVEWHTEDACPEQTTSVLSSCKLSSDQHRFHIDLSPLADKIYNVSANETPYDYQIRVCTNEPLTCGPSSSSVCQRKRESSSFQSTGSFSKQIFKYSDGKLQMIMGGGDECGTGYQRTTIINFYCDPSAYLGSPRFRYEEYCTYVFDWGSSLVCFTPPVSCSLKRDDITYDLSSLSRTGGDENWRTSHGSDVIFNICSGLLPSDSLASNCSSSAICAQVNGTYVNYGRVIRPPTYVKEKKAVAFDYVDGQMCIESRNISYNATLMLFCDPVGVNQLPYVFHVSDDKCRIDLQWHTRAACGASHIEGHSCVVKDSLTGLKIDLSPLKLSDGQHYKVSNDSIEHDYYINICGPVSGMACSDDTGVCQISKKNPNQAHNTGKWSEDLHYKDGMLKLTYKDGDPYNSNPPVARHTDIEFVCDLRAGNGLPIFLSETNRTYKFIWYTSLACQSYSTRCSASGSDGRLYDFSDLLHQGESSNWMMAANFVSKTYKLVINVCRNILADRDTKSCDPNSSACLVGENNDEVISLGQFSSGPVVKKNDVVTLRYTNGSRCKENSSLFYSLQIDFICARDTLQGGPIHIRNESSCSFILLWLTDKACGNNSIDNNNNNNNNNSTNDAVCEIKDINGNQKYNFASLKNKTFNISSNGLIYKVAICGNADGCGEKVGACRVDSKGEKDNLAMSAGGRLVMNKYGNPELIFSSETTNIKVLFVCKPLYSSSSEVLELVGPSRDWFMFSLATPAACLDEVIKCQADDEKGNKYDLEPLTKTKGGWVAKNSNGDSCEINVCRAFSSPASVQCSSVGACLLKKSGQVVDAGHVKGTTLRATSVGTLRLDYVGGDSCSGGNGRRRSTSIVFYCSPVSHDPVLLSNDVDACEILIQWATPFACPSEKSVGSNCAIPHPLFPGQIFNVSDLGQRDVSVDFVEGTFYLRVCHPVESKCVGENAGGCLVSGSQSVNMGTYNGNLQYSNGELTLIYTTPLNSTAPSSLEKCTQGLSTEIHFICEHDNLGLSSGPIYTGGLCRRQFEWTTSLACFTYREVMCKVRNSSGFEVDLSHLMLHDKNYEVYAGNNVKFIINICTTLVRNKDNPCPPDSAACRIDSPDGSEKKFRDIGKLPNGFETTGKTGLSMTENGDIKLVYEGDECGGAKVSTVIQFVCDPMAVETLPKFLISENNNCTFIFEWKTRAVCYDQSISNMSCAVRDPETGHIYDLTSLIDQTYSVNSDLNHKFEISVCGPLKNSSCGPLSASCQMETGGEKRQINAGKANSLLTFEHGAVMLRYSGGQFCVHANKSRETLINFICPFGREQEGLEFMTENADCVYMFMWKTKLACRNELKCSIENGRFDLSTLMKQDGAYNASFSQKFTDVADVFINVCAPVYGQPGCGRESSVCVKKTDEGFLNAGSISEEPFYDASTKKVIITYTNGSECSEKQWSSKIIFSCSPTSDPNPVLISINDCTYTFQWNTDIVCSSSGLDQTVFKNCTFISGQEMYNYSGISNLKVSLKNQRELIINLCSDTTTSHPNCDDSQVCLLQSGTQLQSYGDKSLQIMKEGKNVKFYYAGSGTCVQNVPGSTYQASLIFNCDATLRNQSVIDVLYESNCTIVLKISSAYVCPIQQSDVAVSQPTPTVPSIKQKYGKASYVPFIVIPVVIVCVILIVGAFAYKKRLLIQRNQQGYERVESTMNSRDFDGDSRITFFREEELQNFASDDDLLL